MEEERKDGLWIIVYSDGKRELLLKELIQRLPSVKEYRKQEKDIEEISLIQYALVVDRKERHILEEFLEFVGGAHFYVYLSVDLAFPDYSDALEFVSRNFA